jgi:hypothetical protein
MWISWSSTFTNRWTFGGLKFHNYHILMQQVQVFSLTLHGFMAPNPIMANMCICKVYRHICNKVWNLVNIDSFYLIVVIIVSLTKMDSLIFLQYHDTFSSSSCWRLKLMCHIVTTRWMYPNMAQIERSVAKSYNYDECLGFVTKYLQRFQVVKSKI